MPRSRTRPWRGECDGGCAELCRRAGRSELIEQIHLFLLVIERSDEAPRSALPIPSKIGTEKARRPAFRKCGFKSPEVKRAQVRRLSVLGFKKKVNLNAGGRTRQSGRDPNLASCLPELVSHSSRARSTRSSNFNFQGNEAEQVRRDTAHAFDRLDGPTDRPASSGLSTTDSGAAARQRTGT